jgi:hypothetical protein
MEITIDVERLDLMDFMVTLVDDTGPTQHTVIATQRDHEVYAPNASVEDLVAETFRFLLEREPHSMIQAHFALEDIARMFIDYEFEMKRRFAD